MTLTQMRYFATTCELQNISLAAQMLYISQPALSATLADLEKEVGFKLFNRKSKGVIPTEEGLLLLQHINSVLKRANLLQQEIPLISRHQQVIRVGFRPYSGETVFFRLFKQYQSECGTDGLILKVNEMSNITPYVFLDENQIDFLFGSTRSMPPAGSPNTNILKSVRRNCSSSLTSPPLSFRGKWFIWRIYKPTLPYSGRDTRYFWTTLHERWHRKAFR